MKKTKTTIAVSALLASLLAYPASLEENVQAIETAARDIASAILAKGGDPSGGLTNAANAILNIPEKDQFEHVYIAWSNATVNVDNIVTNSYVETGYQLLPYLQVDGGQFFKLTEIRANQDTFSELKFTDLDTTGTTMLFGSRYSNLYEMHIYNGGFGFPYYNAWYDNVGPAMADAVLAMDGNNFYIDGVLKQTVTKTSFNNTDYLLLFSSRSQSGYKTVTGKFYYADIQKSINPSNGAGNPDVLLLPALDPNGTVCVVDVKSNPSNPTRYYRDSSYGHDWPEQPVPTNQWIYVDITTTSYSYTAQVPYETNIVSTAINKQIINDATEYIYQRISDLDKSE